MTAGKPPDQSDPGDDSLDFSQIGPSRAPPPEPAPVDHQPQRAAPKRRRAAAARAAGDAVQDRAPRSRIGVILIVIAIGAGAAYVMMDQEPTEPEAPVPAAEPKAPAYQAPPAPKPAQAPSAKPATAPPSAAPAQGNVAPTIPADFLKAFKDYQARPGSKAIALALDRNGRWAYGIIAGHLTQAEADKEALAECTKHKPQAGVQENCRLYASGDKVVW